MKDSQKVEAALKAFEAINFKPGCVFGAGTGSTVFYFLKLLKNHPDVSNIATFVSSSEASTKLLVDAGFKEKIKAIEDVDHIDIYVDGADEVTLAGDMIKGGGGALTREKAIAAKSSQFICIVNMAKRVDVLGKFSLPIAVKSSEWESVKGAVEAACPDSEVACRKSKESDAPYVTDDGNYILDVAGLNIKNPAKLEAALGEIPGVVTVGIFTGDTRADVTYFGIFEGTLRQAYGKVKKLGAQSVIACQRAYEALDGAGDVIKFAQLESALNWGIACYLGTVDFEHDTATARKVFACVSDILRCKPFLGDEEATLLGLARDLDAEAEKYPSPPASPETMFAQGRVVEFPQGPKTAAAFLGGGSSSSSLESIAEDLEGEACAS